MTTFRIMTINIRHMETLTRSWMRVLSWRVLTTIIAFIILYVMTGQWALSISFTLVNAVVQTVFHLWHERAWEHVKWGKTRQRKGKFLHLFRRSNG